MCSAVEHTVIESVELEPGGRGGEVLVARVRPKAGAARRCSRRCGRRCPGYDTSATPRRWRGVWILARCRCFRRLAVTYSQRSLHPAGLYVASTVARRSAVPRFPGSVVSGRWPAATLVWSDPCDSSRRLC